MSDVCQAIIAREVLEVGPEDIVRDYVDPGDLAVLLSIVIESGERNDVYDVYSAGPVRKSALSSRSPRAMGCSTWSPNRGALSGRRG